MEDFGELSGHILSQIYDLCYTAQDILNAHPYVYAFFIGWISACLASFFGVVVDRLPLILNWRENKKNISINTPSSCNNCHTRISPLSLIPIIGYILSKGKCNHCGQKIPVKYTIIESLTFIISFLSAIHYGVNSVGIAFEFVLMMSLLIGWFDWEEGLIPDRFTFPLIAVGLLYSPFCINPWERSAGMVMGAFIMISSFWMLGKIKKIDLMASGDVIMVACAGSFLGVYNVIQYMFITCFVYIIHCSILKMKKYKWIPKDGSLIEDTDEDFVPFGPALCVALCVNLFLLPHLHLDFLN